MLKKKVAEPLSDIQVGSVVSLLSNQFDVCAETDEQELLKKLKEALENFSKGNVPGSSFDKLKIIYEFVCNIYSLITKQKLRKNEKPNEEFNKIIVVFLDKIRTQFEGAADFEQIKQKVHVEFDEEIKAKIASETKSIQDVDLFLDRFNTIPALKVSIVKVIQAFSQQSLAVSDEERQNILIKMTQVLVLNQNCLYLQGIIADLKKNTAIVNKLLDESCPTGDVV